MAEWVISSQNAKKGDVPFLARSIPKLQVKSLFLTQKSIRILFIFTYNTFLSEIHTHCRVHVDVENSIGVLVEKTSFSNITIAWCNKNTLTS